MCWFIIVSYRIFIAEFWILYLRCFFSLIADILHINCLILQKWYSVLLEQSHCRISHILIPYSAWLSGITPTQATALQYQPCSSMACAVWGNTLETEFCVPLSHFSCICTVIASKFWYFWEFPLGPEWQMLKCSASSVQPGCRLSGGAQGKLQVSNTSDTEQYKIKRFGPKHFFT